MGLGDKLADLLTGGTHSKQKNEISALGNDKEVLRRENTAMTAELSQTRNQLSTMQNTSRKAKENDATANTISNVGGSIAFASSAAHEGYRSWLPKIPNLPTHRYKPKVVFTSHALKGGGLAGGLSDIAANAVQGNVQGMTGSGLQTLGTTMVNYSNNRKMKFAGVAAYALGGIVKSIQKNK